MTLLMFDYGHGGKDPGATYKGRKESDDVLRLGKAVAYFVRAAGIKVEETRTNDTYLALWERSQLEREKNYDYFISFHRNASRPEQGTGVEAFVYTSNNAKSKAMAAEIIKALVRLGFKDRGVKSATYHVLEQTYAPAILLEVGFIDNSKDNDLFDSKFEQIAAAIAQSIIKVTGGKIQKNCAHCGKEIVTI